MPPRRGSLWVEIGVSLALLTVLVSILDAGVFWIATRVVLTEASEVLAENTARVIATELAAAERERWPSIVEQNRRHGLRGLSVWSPKGDSFLDDEADVDSLVKRTLASREVFSEVQGNEVRVVAPVGEGRPSAVVSLRYPLTTVERPAWGAILAHATFSAIAIVVFGLLLFRRSVVEPIRRIGDAVARIAGGDFGARVPDDAPAELAELAAGLSAMSAALATYRENTARQLESLEQANRDLQSTQDALVRSEKLASVGRLAAGLAHELGNPLAAVRGYTELLVSAPDAPGNDELLRRSQLEVERMHDLLRNLLDFARADEGAIVEVGADDLLAEAARTVELQAAFRGVEVRCGEPSGARLRGEPAKLHQVLVNLLLNASDAGATRIQLRSEADAHEVRLSVADDGEGIAPESVPRLFEPFYSTRPPGKGTGLGLAIAFRVMEQHGGRIEVESTPGRGSVFTLHLPSVAAAGAQAAD